MNDVISSPAIVLRELLASAVRDAEALLDARIDPEEYGSLEQSDPGEIQLRHNRRQQLSAERSKAVSARGKEFHRLRAELIKQATIDRFDMPGIIACLDQCASLLQAADHGRARRNRNEADRLAASFRAVFQALTDLDARVAGAARAFSNEEFPMHDCVGESTTSLERNQSRPQEATNARALHFAVVMALRTVAAEAKEVLKATQSVYGNAVGFEEIPQGFPESVESLGQRISAAQQAIHCRGRQHRAAARLEFPQNLRPAALLRQHAKQTSLFGFVGESAAQIACGIGVVIRSEIRRVAPQCAGEANGRFQLACDKFPQIGQALEKVPFPTPTQFEEIRCAIDQELTCAEAYLLTVFPNTAASAVDEPTASQDASDGKLVSEPESAAQRTRPPRKRAVRAAKIEALTLEMMEHLSRAKDHAFETKTETGVARLLPRPEKQHLAELTNMEPYDVSRCLTDKSAKHLRVLWDTANDLEQVMRLGLRRRRIRNST